MSDVKTFALFLPFLTAACYGLAYALNEKIFSSVGISTYILGSSVAGLVWVILLHSLTPYKLDFSPLMRNEAVSLFFLSVLVSSLGWVITCFAIKNVSANYAAIAEISYPLFTALFGYLIFSRRLSWTMAVGAGLIFAGVFLIVREKLNGG